MRVTVLFTATLLMLCIVSCDTDMVYDQYRTTENGMWGWQDTLQFRTSIIDTTSMNNNSLQVRHSVDYPMSNLYMYVHIQGPEGQSVTDTVNMILAAPDGEWNGKGTGHIRELMLLYRKQTRFSVPGTYTFTLEQAMRQPELPVTDLGIRIERVNP
jgi:gliding motility-associated lipoprotein GldH